MFKPASNLFTDRSKAGLLLCVFFFFVFFCFFFVLFFSFFFCYLCFVFVLPYCSVSISVTCWERTDLLVVLYVMVLVFYLFLIRCPVLGVVLGCIDSWSLPSSYTFFSS